MKSIGIFDLKLDCEYYKKKILKNEPKIIKKYPPTAYNGQNYDGGTGLGLNSLTSRFYHFNVLQWFGTKSLRREIKRCYKLYTSRNEEHLFVQCWANVMRNGQQIKPHSHRTPIETHAFSAVSGNLVIYSDRNTNTYYAGNPVQNKINRMVLFPSDVIHWTDEYVGSSQRITVAFDVRTYRDWKCDVSDDAKKHWIKI